MVMLIFFDLCRSDSEHLKECKEPCVASSQGPDIIPEKSYFQGKLFLIPYKSSDKISYSF